MIQYLNLYFQTGYSYTFFLDSKIIRYLININHINITIANMISKITIILIIFHIIDYDTLYLVEYIFHLGLNVSNESFNAGYKDLYVS